MGSKPYRVNDKEKYFHKILDAIVESCSYIGGDQTLYYQFWQEQERERCYDNEHRCVE